MSRFNEYTVSEFISFAVDEAIAHGTDIVISVGEEKISVPVTPETFEGMEKWLYSALKIWEEDYL